MQFVYKALNKIVTQLITWGNPFDCDGLDVIVCVSGNPGVPDFYIEFGEELHKSTGLPVCVIGQAGHIHVPDKESNTLKGKENLFNLEGQIAHKLDLLSNHIDKKSKIHLIGHSIGAWMSLELLHKHDSIKTRVASVNLLFPTIQRMAETTNGKFLNDILRRVHIFIMFLFILVNFIPQSILSALVGIYLKFSSLPPHYNERILKYLHPSVGEKVLFLAYDEMDKVRNINTAALDKIKHFTNVIYSTRDGWAPVSYMDDLRPFQPHLQMKEVNISHAFVLKSSERVAQLVSDFIKSKCSVNFKS